MQAIKKSFKNRRRKKKKGSNTSDEKKMAWILKNPKTISFFSSLSLATHRQNLFFNKVKPASIIYCLILNYLLYHWFFFSLGKKNETKFSSYFMSLAKGVSLFLSFKDLLDHKFFFSKKKKQKSDFFVRISPFLFSLFFLYIILWKILNL